MVDGIQLQFHRAFLHLLAEGHRFGNGAGPGGVLPVEQFDRAPFLQRDHLQ